MQVRFNKGKEDISLIMRLTEFVNLNPNLSYVGIRGSFKMLFNNHFPLEK